MKKKRIITALAMAAIIASISTMGASAATGNGDTASTRAISNYSPTAQTWSTYKFIAQGSDGQSLTYVKNIKGKDTKVVVEASRWDKYYRELLGESYNEDIIGDGESVQTSVKQDSKRICQYTHSADIYGSTTGNTIVHNFNYDIKV